MSTITKLTIVAVLSLGVAGAQAASIKNSFGLTSPDQALTFDEVVLPINTVVTNQYAGFGVTFSGSGGSQWDYEIGSVLNNISGGSLNNFPGGSQTPLFIEFAAQQAAAAFAMVTNSGTSTFTALLGGTGGAIVESFSSATSTSDINNFFGFKGITFDTIKIDVGGSNNAMLLDNLQNIAADPVPEPASVMLLATGLVGVFGYARRRKAA